MGDTTKIQWCDMTFNPWVGCTKVSPGCANCYAERDFDLRKHVAKWGAGQPRHRTSETYWKQPLKWDREAALLSKNWTHRISSAESCGMDSAFVSYLRKQQPHRPRVFCASLADWLDDEVPIEWLADLLNLWRACSNLDILALTKRPQLWRERMEAVFNLHKEHAPTIVWDWFIGRPPANVWIGTTVEDQARADERIPALLKIPARVRFLSCEPLLGPVDLGSLVGIDWVICGGESGPNARPMDPEWARSLRDQCAEAGVPFLFKQWGQHNEQKLPVGKHAAGRLLDGREHNEFPKVQP